MSIDLVLIPAIGLFWAFGGGILGLLIIAMWIVGLVDISRRPDLEGSTKAGWILLVVLLPIAGTLIYMATRPTLPEERDKIIAAQTRRH